MSRLLIRWGINAVAIWAAFAVVPGVRPIDGEFSVPALLVVALVFGLVNAIIRPILTLLTCPLIILTLGLGTLLINAAMFYLTSIFSEMIGFGFVIDGFWAAFWGGLVVSIVSVVLSVFFRTDDERKHDD